MELTAYFESLVENPTGVRSLADLIAYNDNNKHLEQPTGMENQDRYVLIALNTSFLLFLTQLYYLD